MSSKSIKTARSVLATEGKAILDLAKKLDRNFEKAVDFLSKSKGRVIVTGMGKPGFIAQKISATLSSTGTPSLYLHPAEALHGDLGRVTRDDCLLPILKKIGSRLIAVTGNKKSTLAKNSDFVIDASVKKEACSLGLAPTTSTTAMLAVGDALCVSLLDKKGFREKDFAFYHPGGALGKRLLLRVSDIMRTGASSPIVKETALVKDALIKITKSRAGSASVVNKKGMLVGIFTDGDLRRHINSSINIARRKIKEVMTKSPVTIRKEKLAAEAFQILRSKKIDEIPVVDEKGRPVGLLDVQDILKAGLV